MKHKNKKEQRPKLVNKKNTKNKKEQHKKQKLSPKLVGKKNTKKIKEKAELRTINNKLTFDELQKIFFLEWGVYD